jgi:hypothetical protein
MMMIIIITITITLQFRAINVAVVVFVDKDDKVVPHLMEAKIEEICEVVIQAADLHELVQGDLPQQLAARAVGIRDEDACECMQG